MTDRELLEAAAKAAGIPLKPDFAQRFDYYMSDPLMWSPLTNDGDAFRLAVKLGIGTRHHLKWSQVFSPETGTEDFSHEGDPCAATRRAVVRAAAAIGANLE